MKSRSNPLRSKYDLSQQELAHFMELPLSTVAMWESRQRTLPTKGLLRLALLENAWSAAQNQTLEDAAESEIPEMIAKLKKRMEECLHSAGLLQKMLEAMSALYTLLKTKQKTLELLSEPGTSNIYQGWIEIQQYQLRKPLAENSPVKQIMIQHQAKALHAEAAAAAATIKTLEQQMQEALTELAVEEKTATYLPGEVVDTTLAVQQKFIAAIETPPLPKQVHASSFRPKKFIELYGSAPQLKRIIYHHPYYSTTSTGTTARRRVAPKNLSRRVIDDQTGRKSVLNKLDTLCEECPQILNFC